MTFLSKCRLGFVLAALLSNFALATTSSTSSAASTSSASLGSSSTSIEKSSDSSTSDKKVTAGDYKIMGITADAGRPGVLRLRLLPQGERPASHEFDLLLPQTVAEQAGLVPGTVVAARERPYGLEFSVSGQTQAFFLVLHDDWYRELHNHAVTL
jgi:hypothetical protein